MSCGAALPDQARVGRAVDGDTVELSDHRLVRYIGIDAPEVRRRARPGDPEWRPPRRSIWSGRGAGEGDRWVSDPQPFGEAAAEANRRLIEGKVVRLEYDVQTHDRYGRLLAYVYVGPMMINAELLRLGYAQPLTIPPNVKHAETFRALAADARRKGLGLWASGGPSVERRKEPVGRRSWRN